MIKLLSRLVVYFGVLLIAFSLAECWKVNDFIGVRRKHDSKVEAKLGVSSNYDATKDRFFYQILDHSDKISNKTWKQVYFCTTLKIILNPDL